MQSDVVLYLDQRKTNNSRPNRLLVGRPDSMRARALLNGQTDEGVGTIFFVPPYPDVHPLQMCHIV